MAEENVQYNAFLQMNETLSTGIREALLSIADAALSKKMIHENTHSEVLNVGHPIEIRTQNFLKAIRDRIRIDPSAFHVFVSVLKNQHSMEFLGTKLMESFHNQIEDLRKRQAVALADARALAANSSPNSRLVVNRGVHGGQPVVTRPTQLVAPGEKLHSYVGMQQRSQLPAKSATFSGSHNHSGILHHSSLVATHPTVTMGADHEPWSEPVIKYTTTSPEMLFRKRIVKGTSKEDNIMSSTSEVNAVTRRAITPGPEASNSLKMSSSGLTGKSIPRTFGKNYSDLQQRLDSMCILNPHDTSSLPLSSPLETPKHISTLQHPGPVASSDNHSPSLAGKFKHLSITTDTANIGTPGDTHTVASSPGYSQVFNATVSCTMPGDEAMHTVLASTANAGKLFTPPPPCDERTLNGYTDDHGNLTTSNTVTMTTPMPAEPTVSVPPSPPTTAEGLSNGVTESQTIAAGSDSLAYDHNVMRAPSLQSGSSIDSTDDSAEVDPIQASEKSDGSGCTMLTSGNLKPGGCSKDIEKQKRKRCERCVQYKEETSHLKKELHKLQRTLSSEREQSNAQVHRFREELYHIEQQAKYEISLSQSYNMHDAELRHQQAARIIQKLQRELQLVEKERDSFKNAYDLCSERCQMLKADLQRVDSMQCPEYYEQYKNTITPDSI